MTTAADVTAAIAARYEPPAWAVYYEVGDTTGGRSRSADAIAVSLWPSRGLEIHGFEIKISRGDWLRELKAPEKSAPIQRFCDRWWIATSNAGIIRPGELPPTWGHLLMRGGSLHMVADAPVLEAEPLGRPFMCALLRAASQGFVPRSALNELVAKRVEERTAFDKSHAERELTRVEHRLTEVEQAWQALTEVVGHDVTSTLRNRYSSEAQKQRLRAALQFLAGGGLKADIAPQLEITRDRLRAIAEELDAVAAAARGETAELPPPIGVVVSGRSLMCPECARAGEGGEAPGDRCGALVAFRPCDGTLRVDA